MDDPERLRNLRQGWLRADAEVSAFFASARDLVCELDANGVFVQIPRRAIAKLQKRYFFYVWNEAESVVRWMCSWDTTEDDVRQFAEFVAQVVAA